MPGSNGNLKLSSTSTEAYINVVNSGGIKNLSPDAKAFIEKVQVLSNYYNGTKKDKNSARTGGVKNEKLTGEILSNVKEQYRDALDSWKRFTHTNPNKRTSADKKYMNEMRILAATLMSDNAAVSMIKPSDLNVTEENAAKNKNLTLRDVLSDKNKNKVSIRGKVTFDGATMSTRIPLKYKDTAKTKDQQDVQGFFTPDMAHRASKKNENGDYYGDTLNELRGQYKGYETVFDALSGLNQTVFFTDVVGAKKDEKTGSPSMVYGAGMRPTIKKINQQINNKNLAELREAINKLKKEKKDAEPKEFEETINDILGRTYEVTARNYKANLSSDKLGIPDGEDIPKRNDMFSQVADYIGKLKDPANPDGMYGPQTKQMSLQLNGGLVTGTFMATGKGLDVERPKENSDLLKWSNDFEIEYAVHEDLYKKAEELYFEKVAEMKKKDFNDFDSKLKNGKYENLYLVPYITEKHHVNGDKFSISNRKKFAEEVLPFWLQDAALALSGDYENKRKSAGTTAEKARYEKLRKKCDKLQGSSALGKPNNEYPARTLEEEASDAQKKFFAKVKNSLTPKKRVSGNAMEKLSDIQVMDFVNGNVDRHEGNILYKFKTVGDVVVLDDVECIDNDMSFGTVNTKKDSDSIKEMDDRAKDPQSKRKYGVNGENALENYCSPKNFKYISADTAKAIEKLKDTLNDKTTEKIWRDAHKDIGHNEDVYGSFKKRVNDFDKFIKESESKYNELDGALKNDVHYLLTGYPRVISKDDFDKLDIMRIGYEAGKDVGNNVSYFTRMYHAAKKANDNSNMVINEVKSMDTSSNMNVKGIFDGLKSKVYDVLDNRDTVVDFGGKKYDKALLEKEYGLLAPELKEINASSDELDKKAILVTRKLFYNAAMSEKQVVYNEGEFERKSYRSEFDVSKEKFRSLRAEFAKTKPKIKDSDKYKNMMSALDNVLRGFDGALSEAEMEENYKSLQTACTDYLKGKDGKKRFFDYGVKRFNLAHELNDLVDERALVATNSAIDYVDDMKTQLTSMYNDETDPNLKDIFDKGRAAYGSLGTNLVGYREACQKIGKDPNDMESTNKMDQITNKIDTAVANKEDFLEHMMTCEMVMKERRTRRDNKEKGPGPVENYLRSFGLDDDFKKKLRVEEVRESLKGEGNKKITVVDICNKLGGYNVAKHVKTVSNELENASMGGQEAVKDADKEKIFSEKKPEAPAKGKVKKK